ncbi:hypothetical protein WJX72_009961 [[Myrmecia] bisecta]|uniref:Protein kinase domain-containing protein n=1 Tax=[Myrmecia] bisecta TaxID=41462 RepID=A0AAW1PY80_9CHLO
MQGRIVGKRYRIIKQINSGATAVVYAAEDIEATDRTPVALKVMNAENGRMIVSTSAVRREIEYASTLRHPHVVQLLDVFAERERIVIVWELIQGPDLLDLLNECGGKLSEMQAAFYFEQLLQAVDFLHATGLCHRDLKPENCMVDRATQQLKLIDFGLSKHLESAKTLGVGTLDYMCPEMLAETVRRSALDPPGHYDPKAVDVWGLGVILYLMVTGEFPFQDNAHPESAAHTLRNIMAGRMQAIPPGISRECALLITSALESNPAHRVTLEEMLHCPWLGAMAERFRAQLEATQASLVDAGTSMGLVEGSSVEGSSAGG